VVWYDAPARRAARLGSGDLNAVAVVDDGAALLVVGEGEAVWYLPLGARWMAAPTSSTALATALPSPVGRGMALNAVAADVDGSAIVVGERGLALALDARRGAGELSQVPAADVP
jgi:peptide/nickel transport system permease protein